MTGSDVDVSALYMSYLAAIQKGDRGGAFELIDNARDQGADLGTLYMDVFQPTLREIGRLWQNNKISVADEHLATAITQAAMARAFDHAFVYDSRPQLSIVAACADVELHEVGLRMICDLLEMDGWDTTYLGTNVPAASLIEIVQGRRPHAVALSVTMTQHVGRIAHMIESIRAEVVDPPLILVGGRPFLDDPTLATRIGADLTAADARETIRLLKQKIGSDA